MPENEEQLPVYIESWLSDKEYVGKRLAAFNRLCELPSREHLSLALGYAEKEDDPIAFSMVLHMLVEAYPQDAPTFLNRLARSIVEGRRLVLLLNVATVTAPVLSDECVRNLSAHHDWHVRLATLRYRSLEEPTYALVDELKELSTELESGSVTFPNDPKALGPELDFVRNREAAELLITALSDSVPSFESARDPEGEER